MPPGLPNTLNQGMFLKAYWQNSDMISGTVLNQGLVQALGTNGYYIPYTPYIPYHMLYTMLGHLICEKMPRPFKLPYARYDLGISTGSVRAARLK